MTFSVELWPTSSGPGFEESAKKTELSVTFVSALKLLSTNIRFFVFNNPGVNEMGTSVTCGNVYDTSFDIVKGGKTYTFDSFGCAIAKLAPLCEGCGVRVIGHGLQSGDRFFCCDHCAEGCGVTGLEDRS